MYRIVHEAPDISAVPPGLRPLVEAALAKDPQARPTAAQLLGQLASTRPTQHRRAVREPDPDRAGPDLAPVRDRPAGASRRTHRPGRARVEAALAAAPPCSRSC